MVDIHAHILPGIDDGPSTLVQSLDVLRAAAAAGTTDIVATPHANSVYRFDPEKTRNLIAEVQAQIGNAIRIHPGCEMHLLPENIEDAANFPAKYAISGGAYVLVEMSDLGVPESMMPVFDVLQAAGLRPILAHPERNVVVRSRPEVLRPLVGRGILMQLTANSLRGNTSPGLIKAGFAHFIASDTHGVHHRHPNLAEWRSLLETQFGNDVAELLCRTNPAAVVSGGNVQQCA